MKRILIPVLFGVVLTIGVTPALAGDVDEMLAGGAALGEEFTRAFNEADSDAVAACYWNSPETVFFSPGTLQETGKDSIREGLDKMFEGMKGARIELNEIKAMVAGDTVISWGLWTITMPGPDGNEVELVGRYTDVKAVRDDKWVYLHDHASVPMAPPPAED
jgi:uncharacterized protein (TIGR02246 family)